ncbi:MAG: DUF1971 domain-containing protein [Acidimicrobiales bacterium]|nr:DUF1971 domain-containing protein [Acidimicrobiales bacterium]
MAEEASEGPPADPERQLPAGLVTGRITPTFTAQSVPAALRRAHHTTVWAELVVQAGSVDFVEEDTGWHTTVTAGHRQVIVPNRRHHIEPSEDATFAVQFYDTPDQTP